MMTVAEACFLVELDKLLKDWEISLDSQDNYNGEDNYSGTDYKFIGEYIDIPIKDLEELMHDAKGKVI